MTLSHLTITEYRIRFERQLLTSEATKLRGFFGSAFADEILLHHHCDGRLLYTYPRVQFKVLQREAHLIGIAEGGELVERLWREVDQARIGQEELPVLEASLSRRTEQLGDIDSPRTYRFVSPWLGLNQENHRRYVDSTTEAERQQILQGVLIGNCLALAKAFDHRVETRLKADIAKLREVPVRLKGVPMIGFRGTFQINFLVPARLGIGKSVSRGFGTVEAVPSRTAAPGRQCHAD